MVTYQGNCLEYQVNGLIVRELPCAQVTTDTSDFDAGLIFEQDPVQIIDALLPLYLNCTLLRSLQARRARHHLDILGPVLSAIRRDG